MNLAFIAPNTLMVSVPLTPSSGNTQNNYIFPTVQELQKHRVVAIETYCVNDMSNDPNNSGYTPPPVTVFNAAFLTLYTSERSVYMAPGTNPKSRPDSSGLWYDKIPFATLRNCENYDATITPAASFTRERFIIRPAELAFNKCKVEFPTGVAVGNNVSAVFKFTYLDLGDPGDDFMKFAMNNFK